MLGRWLQSRGWYREDTFDTWTKLPRPPIEGERVIDVAIVEQTQCWGTFMAVSKELGLPFTRSEYLTVLLAVAVAFVLWAMSAAVFVLVQ